MITNVIPTAMSPRNELASRMLQEVVDAREAVAEDERRQIDDDDEDDERAGPLERRGDALPAVGARVRVVEVAGRPASDRAACASGRRRVTPDSAGAGCRPRPG